MGQGPVPPTMIGPAGRPVGASPLPPTQMQPQSNNLYKLDRCG